VKSIRLALSTSLMAILWGSSVGSIACSSPDKVVESPAPAKVAWGHGDSPEAADESSNAGQAEVEKAAPAAPPAPAPTESGSAEDDAIDLDALAASKANQAPAAEPEPEESEAPSADPATDPVAAELQKRRSEKARKAAKGKKPTREKRASPAAADPAAPASAYKGNDPCRASSFSVARVREACSAGGRSAAKRIMKDAIGKATANGQLLKCGDCHSNQRNYALKANAVADLERWLER
jgi:outer membrane biosynthesis protein TonB